MCVSVFVCVHTLQVVLAVVVDTVLSFHQKRQEQ